MSRFPALLVILTGCPYIFGDTDLGGVDHDNDLDGYLDNEGDCDDSDATVHPGAPELCDGLLNDCDTPTLPADEVDDDGDGYVECTIDARGWQGFTVIGGEDCDDIADAIGEGTFPGAAPKDGLECMKDVDNDDYGDAHPMRTEVATGTDCDDSANIVYPMSQEQNLDGLDNDCDGEADHIILGSTMLTGEVAGDNAGCSISGIGDFNGDGFDDVVVGASQAISKAGAAYLVLGNSAGVSSASLWSAQARFSGETAYDRAGTSVSAAGDVNSDGYQDLLIGAPGEGSAEHLAGATYLILGSSSAGSSMDLANANAKLTGEGDYHSSGVSVSAAGDVDGDGFDDVVVGATGANDGGAAYLVLGTKTGLADMNLKDAQARFLGEDEFDNAGAAVADGGDVNGDGYGDILVGAPGNNAGGSSAGAAYIILGFPAPKNLNLIQADTKLKGEVYHDQLGFSLSGAGDVNGDGYGDILVGAPYADGPGGIWSGTAYLVLGAASGIPNMSIAGAEAKMTGETASDHAGDSLASAGDVNGDGFDDLVVGAPFAEAGAYNPGVAYLILGSQLGVVISNLAEADARLAGASALEYAGGSVGSADTNGDGYHDLLIGADDESTTASDAGAVYIVIGSSF
ncbi:MAG: hypothetical protein HN348_04545 [Proteobacteria bacterium]|nr:hypothetical protein [Pseudomonadota bacterium]